MQKNYDINADLCQRSKSIAIGRLFYQFILLAFLTGSNNIAKDMYFVIIIDCVYIPFFLLI